ncbi:ComC/BlpC family leader-containing pheromone/bacteriocin [Dysgonomonas sp. HDW5A]|nr:MULTISPECIES: ComC/BlpC family leader-containing pheromone/bacteriocin [unclassified Dysgonomonas]QIK54657.1 ComC/BlpC family leader-containing pheromone/bacteriocin [Dysgonomonas sp. HDW5B]QIK60083.1 ComC/BlpC family leader-containing pheromone/bacteriocin [Dysgonomonas sp. HDW5A]
MKKTKIKDFKKLEKKDLKKIQGGVKHYVCINGEYFYYEE